MRTRCAISDAFVRDCVFAYCASVAQYVYSLSAEHCFRLRNNAISDERVRDCALSTHSVFRPLVPCGRFPVHLPCLRQSPSLPPCLSCQFPSFRGFQHVRPSPFLFLTPSLPLFFSPCLPVYYHPLPLHPVPLRLRRTGRGAAAVRVNKAEIGSLGSPFCRLCLPKPTRDRELDRW